MNIKCLLCSEEAGQYKRQSHTSEMYSIYKCAKCGLEYTYPIPSDGELLKFYSDYHDIRADKVIVEKNALRNIELLKKQAKITKNSLVLDFGCGSGDFVDIYGKNCFGIELENHAQHERIATKIEDLKIQKFDCITLFGVLEHLNEIKGTMKKLKNLLKDDGYIVITTVDAEGLIPYFYKPPEHLTYWTSDSFVELADFLGLEIVFKTPYTMIQYGEIYLERLLSRTPEKLSKTILEKTLPAFPKFVEVPTNEIFVLMQKKL